MKIKLGSGVDLKGPVDIDLDELIQSRLLIQANSGGGKSYTGRRFIEQTFGKKQIVVIDPEGEFGNMRTKYDFVYIAKEGGDAVADPRSAALLAKRLMETKANAIIDIYELGSERGEFVKNFFNALVNMPKPLWTDCFFPLDEAHKFAPEKGQGESVALQSVIDMASLGRKRGYCLIPMTQRPAKLSKDVVAECNNKLIGRASLDIDRERSAKELGFRSREDILSLRDLAPGEFYAFGPAISNEVIKTMIGDVNVKPPKRGAGRSTKVAPPTAKVKAILAKLADLPQEAEKEARTIAELRTENMVLKRHKCPVAPPAGASKEDIARAVKEAERRKDTQYFAEREEWLKHMNTFFKIIADIGAATADLKKTVSRKKPLPPPFMFSTATVRPTKDTMPIRVGEVMRIPTERIEPVGNAKFGKGKQVVLAAIASYEEGMTREHITVQTSYKRSTRDAYVQRLIQNGYAELMGDKIRATFEGIEALGSDYKPLPTGQDLIDHHLKVLPIGESAVLRLLIDTGREMSRDEITEATNYQRSTRDAYIQRLTARQLVVVSSSGIKVSPFLV